MTQKQAGLTAIAMAYARAYHATHDSPKIFDDFLAIELFPPEERAKTDRDWASMLQYLEPEQAAAAPDPAAALARVVRLTNGPITLGRSRYTEDCLEAAIANGARQYVILGAGLDTYAYRRAARNPGSAGTLQIFALDHPTTQALMRERAAAAGWSRPANLHYVPIDFTQENLNDALARAPYDPRQGSFFSWLGVSYYLDRSVVLDTLRSMAGIAAPGSQIVFDYLDADAFDPAKSSRHMKLMQQMAQILGEPMKAGFDPQELASELAPLGLRMEENLTPDAIEQRIFRGSDGYHALAHFHYARVRVG